MAAEVYQPMGTRPARCHCPGWWSSSCPLDSHVHRVCCYQCGMACGLSTYCGAGCRFGFRRHLRGRRSRVSPALGPRQTPAGARASSYRMRLRLRLPRPQCRETLMSTLLQAAAAAAAAKLMRLPLCRRALSQLTPGMRRPAALPAMASQRLRAAPMRLKAVSMAGKADPMQAGAAAAALRLGTSP